MALLLLLSSWLHVQTVQRALMPAPQEALCARRVQLVSIQLLLVLQAMVHVRLVLQAHMGLALAFLPQAIAQAVVQAFSRQRWVLFRWLHVHSVGQEHTLLKGWTTAVVPQALQHVLVLSPPSSAHMHVPMC